MYIHKHTKFWIFHLSPKILPCQVKQKGRKYLEPQRIFMTFRHFGGCELSLGQGINKISPATPHLADFRWILHLVHGFL